MYPYNPYHYNSPYYQQYHRNPHYYQKHYSIRNPTQLDPTMFMNSAHQSKNLIKDGQLILEKIAGSKPFSLEMMQAAQSSNKAKVEELIKSTGIKQKPQVSYTPNGLTVTFINEQNNIDCCHLILKIRWGNP
ncbi:MAG TPA: hypothetical protein VM660_01580 [Bacillus sp. (in: firmicutes)]|nr:hypothetical protein [Bacillus sp. (in: firmicutes)]